MNRKYLVVIEATSTGHSAYSPDLPGCVATGASEAEVLERLREAIRIHLDGLAREGYPIPEASSSSAWVEIGA